MPRRAKTLIRLAWRDLRAGQTRVLLLILLIAISAGALTGIRAMAGALESALQIEQKAQLAGDFAIELDENPTPQQFDSLDRLQEGGGKWTLVVLTAGSVRSDQLPDPVIAVIKAVDPGEYPLYGALTIAPAQPLADALAGNSAVVSPELLEELHAKVGGSIAVNGLACRVAGVLVNEPDRQTGSFAIGLRLLISMKTLERSAVLRANPPALNRILVRLGGKGARGEVRSRLESAFPDTGIWEPSGTVPASADFVGSASGLLDIAAWLGFGLGAAGIVVAGRLHAESRRNTLAILKAAGGRPRDALAWMLCQIAMMGAAGGIVGAILGAVSARALLWSLGISAPGFSMASAGQALVAGIAFPVAAGWASAIPFARLRPAPILRASVSTVPPRPVAVAAVWILLGAVSGSWVAAILIWALGAMLALLYQAARWGLKLGLALGRKVPLAAIRHGATSMGPRSASIVAILACITMMSVAAVSGGRMIAGEILRNLPYANANLFVMSVGDSDLANVQAILDRHSAIERPYQVSNLAFLRLVGGVPAGTLAATQTLFVVSCKADQPPGIALDSKLAGRVGARVGSRLEFDGGGGMVRGTVSSIQDMPPADRIWLSVQVTCSALQGQTIFHHLGLRVNPREIPAVMRDLRGSYPMLNVITPDDVVAEIHRVGRHAIAVVRLVAALVSGCGCVLAALLMLAVSGERSRVVAIYQALGARPAWVVRMIASEFAKLGLAAGILGSVCGVALIDAALSAVNGRAAVTPHTEVIGYAALIATLVSAAAGLSACVPLFARRPMEALRRDRESI